MLEHSIIKESSMNSTGLKLSGTDSVCLNIQIPFFTRRLYLYSIREDSDFFFFFLLTLKLSCGPSKSNSELKQFFFLR